jgi:hypothetical protein
MAQRGLLTENAAKRFLKWVSETKGALVTDGKGSHFQFAQIKINGKVHVLYRRYTAHLTVTKGLGHIVREFIEHEKTERSKKANGLGEG